LNPFSFSLSLFFLLLFSFSLFSFSSWQPQISKIYRGKACDVATDLYENIQAVAPCVAVIDERSNIVRSNYVLEGRETLFYSSF
jgi:hypothetical protein